MFVTSSCGVTHTISLLYAKMFMYSSLVDFLSEVIKIRTHLERLPGFFIQGVKLQYSLFRKALIFNEMCKDGNGLPVSSCSFKISDKFLLFEEIGKIPIHAKTVEEHDAQGKFVSHADNRIIY